MKYLPIIQLVIVAALFVMVAALFAVHVVLAEGPVSLPVVITGVAMAALFGAMLHTVYTEYKHPDKD